MKARIIAILLIVLIIALTACKSDVKEYVYQNGKYDILVTEDSANKVRTREVSNENNRVVWTYYDSDGTISLEIYSNDELTYKNSILNPEFHPEKYDIHDTSAGEVQQQVFDSADNWFYYSYSYDHVGDTINWRLSNPYDVPSEKHFTAQDALQQYNAVHFMECIANMKLAEVILERCLSPEAVIAIRYAVTPEAVASANSDDLLIVSAMDCAEYLTPEQVYYLGLLYSNALMADLYYCDLPEN